MMKKGFIIAGIATVAGFIMTGCATTINTNDAAVGSKVAMIPVAYETVIKHTNQKVEGNATMSVLFGVFHWGADSYADRTDIEPSFMFGVKNDIKQAAVYNACKNAKCDILLNSKYTITTKNYIVYKTMECNVVGFPGVEVDIIKKDVPQIPVKPVPSF